METVSSTLTQALERAIKDANLDETEVQNVQTHQEEMANKVYRLTIDLLSTFRLSDEERRKQLTKSYGEVNS